MKQKFTCIICPNSCEITVDAAEDKTIRSVEGNLCPNGETYVREEVTCPRRNIATSVLVEDGELPLASVRLSGPIPKDRIPDALKEIHAVHLKAPVTAGTAAVHNLLGLGVDVIITRSVGRK